MSLEQRLEDAMLLEADADYLRETIRAALAALRGRGAEIERLKALVGTARANHVSKDCPRCGCPTDLPAFEKLP